MLNFSEFLWDRAEKRFLETCTDLRLDPATRVLEFFEEDSFGHQILRSLYPTDQERTKFSKNAGYAQEIAASVSRGIPGMLRNTYQQFMKRYPNQPPDKVKRFFNSLASRMDAWVKTTMGKAQTTVGDDKWAVNSPYMNNPASPPLAQPVSPQTNQPSSGPASPNTSVLAMPNKPPTPPKPTSPNPSVLPLPKRVPPQTRMAA